MDVIEKLIAGHRHIIEYRDIRERLMTLLDQDAFFWDNALKLRDFFRQEVREHFRMEEMLLFPVLDQVITGAERPALEAIEREHVPILKKLEEFEAVAQGHLRYPSRSTREHLAKTAGELLEALIPHAREEDSVMYPLVRERFGPEQYREMEELYSRFLKV